MRVKNKFEEYLNYLKQKGLIEHTIREHRRFLYGAVAHSEVFEKRIAKLKLTDIAGIIEAGRAHGEYGSQRAVVTFRQYLRYLQESGVKLLLDWRDIRVPKVPEKEQTVLDEKEMNRFLRKIPTTIITGLRLRALLEILFATGMRIGEAVSLNKEDIDWKKKEAKIRGKGGEEGMVYFTDRSLRWLKKYLRKRKDNLFALFVNQQGTSRLSTVTARNYLRKFRKEIGIKKQITHHTFRRTLATFLIEKGADIKSTQYLLRHRSERTTLRYYVKTNKRRAKKVHQKILEKV